jgi:hypothetical protein
MGDTNQAVVTSFQPPRATDVASQTARAFIGVRELVLRGEFERGG